MLITITFTLVFLVAVNFLLLALSCNKTTKRKPQSKPTVIVNPKLSTKEVSGQLAPTGS